MLEVEEVNSDSEEDELTPGSEREEVTSGSEEEEAISKGDEKVGKEETAESLVNMSKLEFLAQLGLIPKFRFSLDRVLKKYKPRPNSFIHNCHFVSLNPQDEYLTRSKPEHLCRVCVNELPGGKKKLRRFATCEMCHESYTLKESYDEHMKRRHFPIIQLQDEEGDTSRYFCPCGISLSNFYNFRRHVQQGKTHPKEEQSKMTWKCHSCSATFFGGERQSNRKSTINRAAIKALKIDPLGRLRPRETLTKSWKSQESSKTKSSKNPQKSSA